MSVTVATVDPDLASALHALGAPPAAPRADRVETVLVAQGWVPCGEGDWAIALASPDRRFAARISPFDPAYPFTDELYRVGAGNPYLPRVQASHGLDGGGSLLIMEFLRPVDADQARQLHRSRLDPTARAADPDLDAAFGLVAAVHARALRDLPWCGPLDDNPANVMRRADGHLVLIDQFYAQGRILYDVASRAPDVLAAAIPADRRRYMFDIPAVRRDRTGADRATGGT